MCISHLFLCFEVSEVSEEFSLRWELSRLQEMKQTEEFLHSVLEGSAGQQHLVFLGETTGHKYKLEKDRGRRGSGGRREREDQMFIRQSGNGEKKMYEQQRTTEDRPRK